MTRIQNSPSALFGALMLATLVCSLFVASSASAQTRFESYARGGLTLTGNAIGLSKASGENGPGTEDSIGTFIRDGASTRDETPSNPTNPWPAGTTSQWTESVSAAELDLPQGSTVLHAELIWSGSYAYGSEDLSASLDSSVTLHSTSAQALVSPDPSTAVTIASSSPAGFAINYYIRSADVTSFVQASQAGTYRVEGIPATQDASVDSLNAGGWALLVAYEAPGAPMRYLSLQIGGQWVDENATEEYTFASICAPATGAAAANVAFAALEGDADLGGDQLLVQNGASVFRALNGPNNPTDNFFGSQINKGDGTLDTRGTFGSTNHSAGALQNTVGGRQGWDVTTLDLTGEFNGPSTATFRATGVGDSYLPTAIGLAVDAPGPALTTSYTLPDTLTVGDSSTVELFIDNSSGVLAAQDLALVFDVPPEITVENFSIDGAPGDSNGDAVGSSELAAGASLGNLAAGDTMTVSFDLSPTAVPSGGASITAEPSLTYTFDACQNGNAVAAEDDLATKTWVVEPDDSGGDVGDVADAGDVADTRDAEDTSDATDAADVADTLDTSEDTSAPEDGGSQGDAADGSGGTDTGDSEPDANSKSGCACQSTSGPPSGWLGLLIFGLVVLRRRGWRTRA